MFVCSTVRVDDPPATDTTWTGQPVRSPVKARSLCSTGLTHSSSTRILNVDRIGTQTMRPTEPERWSTATAPTATTRDATRVRATTRGLDHVALDLIGDDIDRGDDHCLARRDGKDIDDRRDRAEQRPEVGNDHRGRGEDRDERGELQAADTGPRMSGRLER